MLKYNLTIALRDILKKKIISSVIVISLSVGFVCSFYISGFVYHELDVDNFNPNKDRIFRLLSEDPWMPENKIAFVVNDVPEHITENYPEVVSFCEIDHNVINKIKIGHEDLLSEFKILKVTPSFFDFFPYPLVSGSSNQVLHSNQDIVISKEIAMKYFGSTNIKGKTIEMEISDSMQVFYISAVADINKINSHLSFDMIISNANKDFRGSMAYLMLNSRADRISLQDKLLKNKEQIPSLLKNRPLNYYLQELRDIYYEPCLNSRIVKTRGIQYIYISLAIGIMLLFVACFNYINLLYSRFIDRIKEFGIKKIIGGQTNLLCRQLFTEFVLLILISLIVAIILLELFTPFFNRLTKSAYTLKNLMHPVILLLCSGILIFIGLVTWLLFKYLLKKQHTARFLNKSAVSNIKKQNIPLLIIFQFAASIILIFATITILKQVNYIHNKDIGLDKEVIELRLPSEYAGKFNILKNRLIKNPAIKNVSVCHGSPIRGGAMVSREYVENGENKTYSPFLYGGDSKYLSILKLKLLKGENFRDNPESNNNKCIINREFADYFGMDNPVGSMMPGTNTEIIGVVDNFLWRSLENPVLPAYIYYTESGSNILIRTNTKNSNEGLKYIRQSWSEIIPDYPADIKTIGDQFNAKHKKQEHLVHFITTFCLISIFISTIGLFALSLFSIQKRTKEIGIRKVNGANSFSILTMLNSLFIKWISIAMIISIPVAYYVMNQWLQNFLYRTELSWWVFVLTGVLTITIAILTVSWQSCKVALRDPVEALRYE